MNLSTNYHKKLLFLFFLINFSYAEDIYKIEVIAIKFSDVATNEKFIKNLDFIPKIVNDLEEDEIVLIPEKFINNALISADLLDLEIDNTNLNINDSANDNVREVFDLYEYTDLESLDFLIGRLRWRENIEIIDSLSWYQPLANQNQYTFHYDEKKDLSLYMNIYKSRYLHIDLKAFIGNLENDVEIKEFISEDRRIKNTEINYFDHPSLGVIIRVTKT